MDLDRDAGPVMDPEVDQEPFSSRPRGRDLAPPVLASSVVGPSNAGPGAVKSSSGGLAQTLPHLVDPEDIPDIMTHVHERSLLEAGETHSTTTKTPGTTFVHAS